MSELMHPLAASFRLDGARADAFLMLHGWTGSPAHFRPTARFVNDQGFTVSVPRLAGHGTSVHDMAGTGWKDWVRSALEGLHDLSEYERIHVVGLSMGGVIGLLLGATCEVASVTTINAPQRLHDRRTWMSRLYRGSRKIRPGERGDPPPGEAAEFWVQYEDSPVGTVPDLLDLMEAARRALPRIRVPVVIIQSKADETVHHTSAETIYDGLASRQKRIVWLERSRHVALLDAESDRIHIEIVSQVASGAGTSEVAQM
jgi:carboxylesterase